MHKTKCNNDEALFTLLCAIWQEKNWGYTTALTSSTGLSNDLTLTTNTM